MTDKKLRLKKITWMHLLIAAIAIFLVFNFAEKFAIEKTVALVLAQHTEMKDGKCMYFDGMNYCEVPENQCIDSGLYAVSLGLCSNIQPREEDASRQDLTGWYVGVVKTEYEARPGERIEITGSVRTQASGKFLVEAGLVDYEKWLEAGRLATIRRLPVAMESVCDGIEYFASGEISQVATGDTIVFNLQPKVPKEEGTYHYWVYITNGCYKDLGENTLMFGESDLIEVKVSGEAVTPADEEEDEEEEKDDDEIVQSVWDDIKSDFSWAGDLKDSIKGTYIIYGIAIIGILIFLALLLGPKMPRRPPVSGGPHYGEHTVRYY